MDILVQHPGFVYRFHRDCFGCIVEQSDTMQLFYKYAFEQGCYLLADGAEPISMQGGRLARTLVVGLNAPTLIKQECATVRYMSPLDWREIDALRSCIEFLSGQGIRERVSKQEARERFCKLGGQVRYVLAHRNEQAAQIVQDNLAMTDFKSLTYNECELVHRSEFKGQAAAMFASPYIRTKFVLRHFNRIATQSGGDGLYSQMVKECAVIRLCLGGNFSVLNLHTKRYTNIILYPRKRQVYNVEADIAGLHSDSVGCARRSWILDVDAVLQPRSVFVIQPRAGLYLDKIKPVFDQLKRKPVQLFIVILTKQFAEPLPYLDSASKPISEPPAWTLDVIQHILVLPSNISPNMLEKTGAEMRNSNCNSDD